ncbi:hypothetical protein [Bacillus atrophaeus]|uniref:hypothetical protein n=1 Tax=Bacillus atrophaeus TaxID=1452 RepID=UPI002E1C27A7|nr:hypothetical protein [Bacillus atrophaeus]
MGEEYLKYRIALLDRYIPYLWKILSKQIDMPAIFIYKANSVCKVCKGLGKLENNDCTVCRSSGKIPLSTKQQYNNIFKKFIKAKQDKEFLENALKTKQYESLQEQGMVEARPNKKDWLCIKCAHNYDGTKGTDRDACIGCVNFGKGNPRGERRFKPMSKRVAKWYIKKGHRFNFGHNSKELVVSKAKE